MAHIIGVVSLNKDVYSLYDIAEFEHISDEKIKSLMESCLKRTQSAAPDKSSGGIRAFFNSIGAADNTINTFFSHSRLSSFAGAIRMETEKTYREHKELYYVMFCVPKSVYHKWKKSGIRYNTAAAPQMSETGLTEKIIPKKTVTLPKIPMLKQFEAILKSMGIKLYEGILLAVQEYMTAHKDVFGEIAATEYDESLVRENKMSLIQAYISPETTNAVYKALQRANMECIVKIKFSEFVDAALCEKLERLPVRYTNPELYKEMREIEAAEKEFLQKGGG